MHRDSSYVIVMDLQTFEYSARETLQPLNVFVAFNVFLVTRRLTAAVLSARQQLVDVFETTTLWIVAPAPSPSREGKIGRNNPKRRAI